MDIYMYVIIQLDVPGFFFFFFFPSCNNLREKEWSAPVEQSEVPAGNRLLEMYGREKIGC